MSKHVSLLVLGVLAAPVLLSGCTFTGAAIGAAATVGTAAVQEGGLSQAASDARIQVQINDLWFRHNVEMFRKLDMTISQGRVLLTGVVQNPEHRVEAVRLAWQPNGVNQVINEITVAESKGIVGYARDAWISARLRTAMTLDKQVLSINYSIDTVQGVIYLMGFAQNRMELNHVIELARTVPDVKRVVSYVKIVGDAPGADFSGGDNVDQFAGNGSDDRPSVLQQQDLQQNYGRNDLAPPQQDYPIYTSDGQVTASQPVSDGPIVITPSEPDTTKAGIEAENLLWQ